MRQLFRCALLLKLCCFTGAFSPMTLPLSKRPCCTLSTISTYPTAIFLSSFQEDFQEQLPSSQVITAVEAAKGQSVIASDIAASAGVSLQQASRDLTALASIAQGDIAVTSEGELVYKFNNNLRGVLAQKSIKYKALQTFQKVWPTAFWAIRVSFGVALVASVLAIFSTIFFISTASSSSDNDDRRRDNRRGGGMNMNFGYWLGPSPFDVFYYRPYGYYGYYNNQQNSARDPDEMSFLESVFSYIFGDGNPNAQIDQERLQLVSQLIRENQGAVTAEQLAPFCDMPTSLADYEDATIVDESFVLPIVSALNGIPQVTEEGEIVYVFSDLQKTTRDSNSLAPSRASMSGREGSILKRAGLASNASTRDIQALLDYNRIPTRGALERSDLIAIVEKALPTSVEVVSDPTLLQERELEFSAASETNKLLAGGLGVVNLGGALWLGSQLSQIVANGYKLPGMYGVVQAGYPLLLGYAILFNAIPLVRSALLKKTNEGIRQRNKRRLEWRAALQTAAASGSGRGRLAKKLQAAKRFGSKLMRLSSKQDIVYDTKETSLEKVISMKEEQALKDFDMLLGDSEGSSSSRSFQ
jgi:hypothetical protein